eukprot:scaffold17203_cov55-Phaeocystis_antarctica.AAC.6
MSPGRSNHRPQTRSRGAAGDIWGSNVVATIRLFSSASQHALRRSVLAVLRLRLEQRAALDGGLEGGEGVARRA